MNHVRTFSLLCMLLAAPAIIPQAPAPEVMFSDSYTDIDAHAEELLSAMSASERLAQVLMVGWETTAPTPELMRWIRERNIGSIKVFGWNGGDVPALAEAISRMQGAALQQGTGIPLLTATDQEGGWVRHIKDLTSLTPGNMSIGASGLAHDAYRSGELIAGELRLMGINMNLAPTVDVYTNPDAHVIGPRAFSDDPQQTGILGSAFFQGHKTRGVVATGKHFPGHGSAAGDSHLLLPTVEIGLQELWERDLLPFRMMITEGIPALLSGHLSFPQITDTNTPASFSHFFNQELLREELEFEGIIITDDLYMYGAMDYGKQYGEDLADLVVRSIRSGSDMVMLSRTPEFNGDVWNTLSRTYREDPEFRAMIADSVRRILRVKLSYLHDPDTRVPLQPDSSQLPEQMPTAETREFFQAQAARAATPLGEDLPDIGDDARVLLTGHNRAFFRLADEFFPDADTYRFQNEYFYFSSPRDREEVRRRAPEYDWIIFALSDPNSAQVLSELSEHADSIIVLSLLSPIYLRDMPWVRYGTAVYGWTEDSVRAGFSVLNGSMEATGTLPLQNILGNSLEGAP